MCLGGGPVSCTPARKSRKKDYQPQNLVSVSIYSDTVWPCQIHPINPGWKYFPSMEKSIPKFVHKNSGEADTRGFI